MTTSLSINQTNIPVDGRQSPAAATVQRGISRMLRNAGHAVIPEFILPSGRRADILSLDGRGTFWIVEIKSTRADFLADSKWPQYQDYCDRFFFACPVGLDTEIFPKEAGLMVADSYGAEMIRKAGIHQLTAARRKALTISFGRTAAHRLQQLHDPQGIAGLKSSLND